MTDVRSLIAGTEHAELVERIRPLLAGRHPALQSAVIADLAAIWLAGHDKALRVELFGAHVALIQQLVAVNAAMMGTEP